MSVEVSSDSAQLEARLTEAAERQPEVVRQWKTEGKLRVMEEMRARTPIRTGFLRESITTAETPDGFMVYPTASYAAFVEKGTQPHTIFPKGGETFFIGGRATVRRRGESGQFERMVHMLHWFSESGAEFFAPHVHHPGFSGRLFVKATFDAVGLELQQLYREILERILG